MALQHVRERSKLFRAFSTKELSEDTVCKIASIFKNISEPDEKEAKAKEITPIILCCKDEAEVLKKLGLE